MLSIRPNASRSLHRGDFNAACVNDVLEVPTDLAETLQRLHARTGEEFLSLLQSFPSAFAAQLNWTINDVYAARDKFESQVAPFMPQAFANAVPPQRHFGAMPPRR